MSLTTSRAKQQLFLEAPGNIFGCISTCSHAPILGRFSYAFWSPHDGFLAWSSHFYAFKLTTIANTVVLLYTGPIYVAILSPLVLKEVREKKANICLILSILGIFLMYNQGLGDELNDRGLMLGAISGILFAFVIMATKKLSKDYSSITIVTMQLFISAIILSPALFASPQAFIT